MRARMGRVLCWAGLGIVVAGSAIAAESRALCKGNTTIVGECVMLHGRLHLSADAGILLWPVGTKRLMGVTGERDMPPEIYPIFDHDLTAVVFGDFEVCPFTKDRPGYRQFVCIETASHVVVTSWPDPQGQPSPR